MQLAQPLQPKRLALQPKLRRGCEHAANFFLRQTAQRRMTASQARQRQIGGKGERQGRRIDPHLRDVAMRRRSTEEFARARRHENMQYGSVEGRIGCVAVDLPILIGEIELNASADKFAVDPDRRVRKIGTGFTIPSTELHDLDLLRPLYR